MMNYNQLTVLMIFIFNYKSMMRNKLNTLVFERNAKLLIHELRMLFKKGMNFHKDIKNRYVYLNCWRRFVDENFQQIKLQGLLYILRYVQQVFHFFFSYKNTLIKENINSLEKFLKYMFAYCLVGVQISTKNVLSRAR